MIRWLHVLTKRRSGSRIMCVVVLTVGTLDLRSRGRWFDKWLVPGCATVCGIITNTEVYSAFHHPGWANWLSACLAEVKPGYGGTRSPVLGGRSHCVTVIPYGRWCSVGWRWGSHEGLYHLTKSDVRLRVCAAGDREKALGMTVSTVCDRQLNSVANIQFGQSHTISRSLFSFSF